MSNNELKNTIMIYKFPNESKMLEFDKAVGEYNGTLGDSLWIYNEGQGRKWFGLQYCGDRWVFQYVGKYADEVGRPVFNFKPTTYEELLSFVLKKIS